MRVIISRCMDLNLRRAMASDGLGRNMSNPLQLAMVSFKQGAYIIVEGKQNANQFFIIRSGKVRISKEVEVVAEEGGNIFGPGDFFGVVSTMSGHSHIETAQAITDVNLISVSPGQLRPAYREEYPGGHENHRILFPADALSR
jgi:CRP-like cAMP-binding protein